jgi:sialate O-acetylesterase
LHRYFAAIFACVLYGVGRVDAAPPALAWVFQDHMVLQRDAPVPVWGTGEAGNPVAVDFAGQRKSTRCDADGRWRVTLDPLQGDDRPQDLTVTAGETVAVRDVLVGEVWVAAGQSNMEFTLAREAHAAAELPAANLPGVRLLNLGYAGQNVFATPFSAEVVARLNPADFYRGSWAPCTTASARSFSAIGYYFAKEVRQVAGVPVGVINLAVGGSPAEAWVRRDALAADAELRPMVDGNWLRNPALDDWCRERGRQNLGDVATADPAGPNHPFKPGFLWDAGLARLVPFAVRGVIWYQGESNALDGRRAAQHERLFPLLVADWRRQWGEGDFPFLYCQLSSIGTEHGYHSESWPAFRDGQRRMLAGILNSGMAVTSDIGNRADVHPRDKRTVGHRLALWAGAKVYGQHVTFSGPLPTGARREGAAVVVTFDHADGGLRAADDKPLAGFEVAGSDGAFAPAQVTVASDRLTVSSSAVADPTTVRYGWQPFSAGNLANGAGLPASTFQLSVAR